MPRANKRDEMMKREIGQWGAKGDGDETMAAGSSCAQSHSSQGLVSAHCNKAIYPSAGGKAIGGRNDEKGASWCGRPGSGTDWPKRYFPGGG
jgi:hypothetical protein